MTVAPTAAISRAFLSLKADPIFLAVIVALPLALAFAIPNIYDPPGALDAYIYSGYSLNLAPLVDRFGPYYYSFRAVHIALIALFRGVFGDWLGIHLFVGFKLFVVAWSVWAIFKPVLSRTLTALAVVTVLCATWLLKTVSTLYLDGTLAPALFMLLALLVSHHRKTLPRWAGAVLIGVLTGVIANANLSVMPFAVLAVGSFLALRVRSDRVLDVVIDGVVMVAASIATQLVIWMAWGIPILMSGATFRDLLHWTKLSLEATSWDYDMFSFVVGKANAQGLSATPTPRFLAMMRAGEVQVFAPLVAILGAIVVRLWRTTKQPSPPVTDRGAEALDAILLASVLSLLFSFGSSESFGNQFLHVPYYLAYLLPFAFLSVLIALADLQNAAKAAGKATLVVVALASALLFVASTTIPSPTFGVLAAPRMYVLVPWLGVCGAALCLPPFHARTLRLAGLGLVMLTLLVAPITSSGQGWGYYRTIFDRSQIDASRDIIDAQRRLIAFTEAHSPPHGVKPQSNMVLFWHTGSSFLASVQSAYVANNTTFHQGSGSQGLPILDDRAKHQLEAGVNRFVVLMFDAPEQREQSHQAIRDHGAQFEVTASEVYDGRANDMFLEYVQITQPAPPQAAAAE